MYYNSRDTDDDISDDNELKCETYMVVDGWELLLWCRLYLLELVLSGLQRITANTPQLNSDLPVSVDNVSFIADEFVTAADMLPTLLVHSDDSEKLVCGCVMCLVIRDSYLR